MKEGASIILHLDCLSAVDCLTDEQAGILFKGLLRYANTGEPLNSSDSALQAVFALFGAQIDRDTKKYEEKCRKNRANACKRYPNRCNGSQNLTFPFMSNPLQKSDTGKTSITFS